LLTGLLRSLFSFRTAKHRHAHAWALLHAGALEDADQACAAIARDSPGLAQTRPLHRALAEALAARGAHARAAFHLECALASLPPPEERRPIMYGLGVALESCGRSEDAKGWYRTLLTEVPGHRDTTLRLAHWTEEKDAEEARALIGGLLSPPDAALRLRRALTLPAIVQSNEQVDFIRQRLDGELDELLHGKFEPIADPVNQVARTPFYLAYHGRDNAALLGKLARVCRKLWPAARPQGERRLPGAGRRLRIGFVSTYFWYHSIGRTTLGWVRDLPRRDFEVCVFAIAPRQDEWAEAYRRHADHYVALPPDLDRVREAIDAAGLDMLLFADIGMHSLTYFLAFWRLAPIQLVAWGHPVTTGIDTLDYFVSSAELEAAGSERHYTEKLLRLPGYFLPRYERPMLQDEPETREALGLPSEARVYYCPQSAFKLHPDFDGVLRAILEADPSAAIVLLDSEKRFADVLRPRFARSLGAAAARVQFIGPLSHAEFLGSMAAADAVLDPLYFGGNNSSCEAFALGIPVVTLPADQLPGRFVMGQYREMQIEECIARSTTHYVDIALRLAREADFRESVSRRIAERSARLFDRPDAGLALGQELLRIAAEARDSSGLT
jgi:protein O-GlcNAc transferase